MIVSPYKKIVDSDGLMLSRFQTWSEQVTDMQILMGVGSPESVVDAVQTTLYMDTAGTAGAILYIKRDTDIGGDSKQGWILV